MGKTTPSFCAERDRAWVGVHVFVREFVLLVVCASVSMCVPLCLCQCPCARVSVSVSESMSVCETHIAYNTCACFRWENGSAILYGGRQGSGPLVLFDQSNNAIAMGPMNSFTVTSLWQNTDGASVHWGIMGGVNQLPAGFQYGVVMIGGDGSVNNVSDYIDISGSS